METIEILQLVFEVIGTIAFAISGALVGIKNKMDVLGIMILGCTTAVGGGIIRDILLGNTPPQALVHPIYTIISFAVALIVFMPPIRKYLLSSHKFFDLFFLLMDSIGLGVFTVVGIQVAAGFDANLFTMIFVGVITGVGGGVMRDCMSLTMPYIFTKHFYATASIIGAILTAILWNVCGEMTSMVIGTIVIFALRVLAAKYHWKLPRA